MAPLAPALHREYLHEHPPHVPSLRHSQPSPTPSYGPSLPPVEQKPKLLEQVRDLLRVRHYSYQTEKTYIHWIKRFIFFHDKRHPREMGKEEVERFLTSLAVDRHVSA